MNYAKITFTSAVQGPRRSTIYLDAARDDCAITREGDTVTVSWPSRTIEVPWSQVQWAEPAPARPAVSGRAKGQVAQ